jgi:hypothetical protein
VYWRLALRACELASLRQALITMSHTARWIAVLFFSLLDVKQIEWKLSWPHLRSHIFLFFTPTKAPYLMVKGTYSLQLCICLIVMPGWFLYRSSAIRPVTTFTAHKITEHSILSSSVLDSHVENAYTRPSRLPNPRRRLDVQFPHPSTQILLHHLRGNHNHRP